MTNLTPEDEKKQEKKKKARNAILYKIYQVIIALLSPIVTLGLMAFFTQSTLIFRASIITLVCALSFFAFDKLQSMKQDKLVKFSERYERRLPTQFIELIAAIATGSMFVAGATHFVAPALLPEIAKLAAGQNMHKVAGTVLNIAQALPESKLAVASDKFISICLKGLTNLSISNTLSLDILKFTVIGAPSAIMGMVHTLLNRIDREEYRNSGSLGRLGHLVQPAPEKIPYQAL